MDGLLIAVVGAVGVVVGVLVKEFFGRRKIRAETRQTTAEAKKTESETEQSETVFYRKQARETREEVETLKRETREEVETLKVEIRELKSTIETAQTKYEQRVGGLHIKMDAMARDQQQTNTQLTDANKRLDEANKTIHALREEVKKGYEIITQLQEKITRLLVDQAKEG